MKTHHHADPSAVAELALRLLDDGDTAGARRLIEGLARGTGNTTATAPDEAIDRRIPQMAAVLVLGSGVSTHCGFGSWAWPVRSTEVAETSSPTCQHCDLDAARAILRGGSALVDRMMLGTSGLVILQDCSDPSLPFPSVETNRSAARQLLTWMRAERSMNEKVYHRVLWAARQTGLPQREIAQLIEQPQTMIFRKLKAVDDDPTLLAIGPLELHDAMQAGRINREAFLTLLAAYPYRDGTLVEPDTDWSYLPGSWDQLTQLALEGAITREEFDAIVDSATSMVPER